MAKQKQLKPRRGSSPATRRWYRPAAYATLLAVACVGLAALAGAALEHAGLRLVESDRAQAVRLLTWASQLSALGPAAAGNLVHHVPLVGPRLAGACWSGLQPESSYALGHAMLQVAVSPNSNPKPHPKPDPHPNSNPNPNPNLCMLQILQSGGGGSGDSRAVATAAAQAVPPLEDAVRGNPSLWPAHANLATIYSGFGDRLRALGALQRAIDILVIRADGAPAPAEPDRVLADLHERQGQLLEAMPQEQCEGGSCAVHALRAYQRAVSHIGDHPAAKAAIERLSPVQIDTSLSGIS